MKIITPIRDNKLSREEEIEYLKAKGVERDWTKSIYSINKGIWGTPVGDLPVGPNNIYYILDSAQINYQLAATDTDLAAGDSLEYFIAEGDGTLPPGITLSDTGILSGITDPLLSLDKRFEAGGYDESNYGTLPWDYGTVSDNGFSSYYMIVKHLTIAKKHLIRESLIDITLLE